MFKQSSAPNELTITVSANPKFNSYEAINEFITSFHFEDAVEISWKMLQASVCSGYFDEPGDRDTLFQFFERVCPLFAAVEKINNTRQKKYKIKKDTSPA